LKQSVVHFSDYRLLSKELHPGAVCFCYGPAQCVLPVDCRWVMAKQLLLVTIAHMVSLPG